MNTLIQEAFGTGTIMGGTPMIIQAKDIIQNYINTKNRIVDNQIHNIFYFGSRVYGSSDSKSDYDFIAIVNDTYGDSLIVNGNITIHMYSVMEWNLLVDRHDIQALECIFLSPELCYINDKHKYESFKIDLWKLRKEISTISSNSWVKGKKKLIITADYDVRLALKSVFHSLRILDIGVQMASTGKINNYRSMNYVLTDLWKMSETHTRQELWELIDAKYRKVFNRLKSQLVELCPKESAEIESKISLKKLFTDHNHVVDEELINDILLLFKN